VLLCRCAIGQLFKLSMTLLCYQQVDGAAQWCCVLCRMDAITIHLGIVAVPSEADHLPADLLGFPTACLAACSLLVATWPAASAGAAWLSSVTTRPR
jgi:hypothetical protein